MNPIELLAPVSSPKRATLSEAGAQTEDDASFRDEVEALSGADTAPRQNDSDIEEGKLAHRSPSEPEGDSFGDDGESTAELSADLTNSDPALSASTQGGSVPTPGSMGRAPDGGQSAQTVETAALGGERGRVAIAGVGNPQDALEGGDAAANTVETGEMPTGSRLSPSVDTVPGRADTASSSVVAGLGQEQKNTNAVGREDRLKAALTMGEKRASDQKMLGLINNGARVIDRPLPVVPPGDQKVTPAVSLADAVLGPAASADPLGDLSPEVEANNMSKLPTGPAIASKLVVPQISVGPGTDMTQILAGQALLGEADVVGLGMSERVSTSPLALSVGAPSPSALQAFNPNQIVQAISVHLETVAKPGEAGQLELRLEPEELGKLRITFTPRESGFLVSFAAERSETLDLLRRHGDALLEDFEQVDLAGSELAFDMQDDEQEWGLADDGEPGPEQEEHLVSDSRLLAVPATMLGGDDRLDIRL